MITLKFVPIFDDREFVVAAEAYESIWREDGRRIVETLQAVSGLRFLESRIFVLVYEGISTSGRFPSDIIKLRAGYPHDVKKGVLVHELGHRLLFAVTERPDDLDEHRLLYLFLFDVFEALYGLAFAERMVAWESALVSPYDYAAAWRWALGLSKPERAARLAAILGR